MLQGAAQLNAKLARFGKSLNDLAFKVAVASKGDVAAATRAEIGDTSLSRWYGGKTQIVGQAMKTTLVSQAEVRPVKRAIGPMRILQSGRNLYGAGDMRSAGVYISRKTGIAKQKLRKVKRAGGRSDGKGTMDDAARRIGVGLGRRSAVALHKMMGVFSR